MKAYDYVDYHARQQPDAEFAVCLDARITYSEARDAANRVAHAIHVCGLDRGDRIAVLMKNCVETVVLYLGAFKAGVVVVPINHRLMPSEWAATCEDAKAKLLICEAQFSEDIEELRGTRLECVSTFIVVAASRSGWKDFDSWTAQESCDAPNVTVMEDDDVLQIYTSGTTGRPKSAVLTHQAVTSNIAQFGLVTQLHPHERFLLVMPLFHAAGIMAMLHTIAWGASLFIQKKFIPHETVEALEKEHVSVAMLAPTMIQTCLHDVIDIADRDFADLRLIIYGASPISVETLRRAMELFRCDFAQRYGTTETLSLTWLTPADHRIALGTKPELLRSAGRPLPSVQIRAVDTESHTVPTGASGEFIVSGPQLMRGYWNSSDENILEIRGERWLPTGDFGFIDADGYVYICDRVKDIIVSGGENISPLEIEDVLREHPCIGEAAVIGVPDIKWGEAVKAIVVLRDGADLSAEQLINFCHERLAGFKTPHSVDFVSEIPRNSSGKVLKYKLREPYWKGQDRCI